MVNKISRCRSSSARSLSYSGSGPPFGNSLLSIVSELVSFRSPETICAADVGCNGCIIGCRDTWLLLPPPEEPIKSKVFALHLPRCCDPRPEYLVICKLEEINFLKTIRCKWCMAFVTFIT